MPAETYFGVWWLPGQKDQKVAGELTIDDSGSTLIVFGSFARFDAEQLKRGVNLPLTEPIERPIIYGYTRESKFTLLGAECCFPTGFGFGTERWQASAAIDAFVEPGEEVSVPVFAGIGMNLQHLRAWVRTIPFTRRYQEPGTVEFSVKYERLAECSLASGDAVRFEQGYRNENTRDGITATSVLGLYVESAEPMTWNDLLEKWVQPFEVLLWLGVLEPGAIEKVTLSIDDGHPWAQLRVPFLQPPRRGTRDLRSHDALFTVEDLPGGFDRAIPRWIGLWNDLKHVLSPLFSRARAPFSYVNDRFYTGISALEAYHAYRADHGRDLERQAHRERVDRLDTILGEHAPDLREWAVNSAKGFNRIPLKRRVMQIVERAGAVGEQLLGSHVETFVAIVEETRNGQAHGESASLSPNGLFLSAEALNWLLRFVLLEDLGFQPDDLVTRITGHDSFRWCAQDLGAEMDRIEAEESKAEQS